MLMSSTVNQEEKAQQLPSTQIDIRFTTPLPRSKTTHCTVQSCVSGLRVHTTLDRLISSLLRLDQALTCIEPTAPKSIVQRPPSPPTYQEATCLPPPLRKRQIQPLFCLLEPPDSPALLIGLGQTNRIISSVAAFLQIMRRGLVPRENRIVTVQDLVKNMTSYGTYIFEITRFSTR